MTDKAECRNCGKDIDEDDDGLCSYCYANGVDD
jgi:NMD protein affecting ribosome stability and mRNA decay